MAASATALSLFSGIGGLDLVAEYFGHVVTDQCEIDTDARRVLSHHWPDARLHGDVTTLQPEHLSAQPDLITSGFPCVDISLSGKGAGISKGTRSGHTWIATNRIVRQCRPRYVLIENVAQLARNGGHRVVSDLAASGYRCAWTTLGARDVGAPHRRERLWLLAVRADRSVDRAASELAARAGGTTAADRHPRRAQVPAVRQLPGLEVSVGDGTQEPAPLTGPCAAALRRWAAATGRPVPDRVAPDGRLSVAFASWFMGYPPTWTDATGRYWGSIGALGNAIVPQCGVAAVADLCQLLDGR